MKLTAKIVGVFVLGMVLLTSLYGYLTALREEQRLKQEMEEQAQTLGHEIRGTLAVAWQERGREGVMQLVSTVESRQERLAVRWVTLSASDEIDLDNLSLDQLRRAASGTVFSLTSRGPGGQTWQKMYYPIDVDNRRAGWIEFSEPLAGVEQYTRGTLYGTAAAVAAMVLCGLLVSLLGVQLVGRPLEQLIGKTQRIGQGDFSEPVHLTSHDELAQLGAALNQMSDQLAVQQAKIREESAAHLAAVEQLRHVDRLKTVGRLASGVAHELGTPLNVVSGHAELISSGRLDGEQVRQSAAVIKSEADRMATIIRQLLDFARRRSPHRTCLDLRDIAAQSLDLLRPLAQKRSVECRLESGGELVTADVDAAQVQQVLTNLVINAVQAMPDGGEVTMQLGTKPAQPPGSGRGPLADYCYVAVRDRGQGITAEDMPHLFEPFYTTKGVGEGTGLGLSVSYGIVQDHGGWIDVESQPGKGSCFTVYLPKHRGPASAGRT